MKEEVNISRGIIVESDLRRDCIGSKQGMKELPGVYILPSGGLDQTWKHALGFNAEIRPITEAGFP